jgi:hypothetical protein
MTSHEVWVQNASIKDLVEYCTSIKNSSDEPDKHQLIHMELVDRIKENSNK